MDNLGERPLDFVDASQELAIHLFKTQNGNNPDGLMAVAQTSIEGVRSLAIIKLEREAGTRVLQTSHQGKLTFDLEHLKDLMLTDRTRVFKVGFFIQEGHSLTSIEGLVSDNQASRGPRSHVADFFLRKFLGCRLQQKPEVTTRNFLEASEEWLNGSIEDPGIRARYAVATLAEIQRNVSVLNPTTFANQYLDLEDRQSYIDHLNTRGVPVTEFLKDDSMVASRLRRIHMELESGIAILGKPDVFEEKIQMTQFDTGQTQIQIVDRVKGMKSRG